MAKTQVLIIGAGPAGLATAGRLRHLGIDFVVLEKSEHIAHSWVNHYDRLHLHTIRRFSGLPHYGLPDDYPQYVPKDKLIHYYQEYARRFSIAPHFGEEVTSVRREEKYWITETAAGNHWKSTAVVVCTGFNRIPRMPELPGRASFPGEIMHSREYRNPERFTGKRVLVVGMGNSGAEIALDLVEAGVDTKISVRSPVNIVPRDLNGRPTQITAKMLDKLPNPIADWISRQVQRLAIGDLSAYGIQRPAISPRAQLRKLAKTPVLDIGTVEKIKSGALPVCPGIDRLAGREVVFADGSREAFDCILCATGYRSAVSDFVQNGEEVLNEHGHPAAPIAPDSHPDLYFVGFDAYASGILESIYRDSRRVVAHILHNWPEWGTAPGQVSSSNPIKNEIS